jgi:hypothetical protein
MAGSSVEINLYQAIALGYHGGVGTRDLMPQRMQVLP